MMVSKTELVIEHCHRLKRTMFARITAGESYNVYRRRLTFVHKIECKHVDKFHNRNAMPSYPRPSFKQVKP